MALHHGMITVDGVQGWYYTPPDNITRCLLHDKQKKLLRDVLQNSRHIIYQELLSEQVSFKLALFQYEVANISVDPMNYTFNQPRIYERNVIPLSTLKFDPNDHQYVVTVS